jgi:hypothetical protein
MMLPAVTNNFKSIRFVFPAMGMVYAFGSVEASNETIAHYLVATLYHQFWLKPFSHKTVLERKG